MIGETCLIAQFINEDFFSLVNTAQGFWAGCTQRTLLTETRGERSPAGKRPFMVGKYVAVKEEMMALSEELLDILACPKCKGDIYLNDTKNGLICENCKLLYEIRDDIPIMLIDEAKPIGD